MGEGTWASCAGLSQNWTRLNGGSALPSCDSPREAAPANVEEARHMSSTPKVYTICPSTNVLCASPREHRVSWRRPPSKQELTPCLAKSSWSRALGPLPPLPPPGQVTLDFTIHI